MISTTTEQASIDDGLGTAHSGDYVNANARLDLLLTGTKPLVGTSWGAGLGSRPAIYGTIVAGLAFLLVIYTFSEAT